MCSSRAAYTSTCFLTAKAYAVASDWWRKIEPKLGLKSAGTAERMRSRAQYQSAISHSSSNQVKRPAVPARFKRALRRGISDMEKQFDVLNKLSGSGEGGTMQAVSGEGGE